MESYKRYQWPQEEAFACPSRGNSPKDRIKHKHEHFKNPLKNATAVDDPEEDIPDVIANLVIGDGLFSMEEYSQAKKSLKRGKCTGHNNMPPQSSKPVTVS